LKEVFFYFFAVFQGKAAVPEKAERNSNSAGLPRDTDAQQACSPKKMRLLGSDIGAGGNLEPHPGSCNRAGAAFKNILQEKTPGGASIFLFTY